MGLVTGLIRLIPGFRHIAAGRVLSGVAWFAVFAATLNFGILMPVAWPGPASRIARLAMCGTSLLVVWLSHRRAAGVERRARRQQAARAEAAVAAGEGRRDG